MGAFSGAGWGLYAGSYHPIPGPSCCWPSPTPSRGQEPDHWTWKQTWVQALALLTRELPQPISPLYFLVCGNAHSAGPDCCSFPPQMEDLGTAPARQATQGTMPIFTSAFQRRAGGVLVASNLQSFLELAYRVLRYLAEP